MGLAGRGAGFMLFILAWPVVPWMLYQLVVGIFRPARRLLAWSMVAIWLVGFALWFAVHSWWASHARIEAQRVVELLEGYIDQHGSCPADLSMVGIEMKALRSDLGFAHYHCSTGDIFFFYKDTFNAFDREVYDFKLHQWNHVYD